ncbi:MAG: hypothetical protein H0S78_06590 [Tissierellales bacterium]|nr:hypothetical protein [Tissierellales bacterium]
MKHIVCLRGFSLLLQTYLIISHTTVYNNIKSIKTPQISLFARLIIEYRLFQLSKSGSKVPDILLSGDHEKIKRWKRYKSIELTLKHRPDLIKDIETLKKEYNKLKEEGELKN